MNSVYHWKFSGPASEIPFDPALRKATSMMKMVVEGLRPLAEPTTTEGLGSVHTYLGSLHGEIEPTLNYLKGLAQKNWPRPFLFQNSLHHSTIGFASQHFEWIGPTYSLCCIRQPQLEILQAGFRQSGWSEAPLLFIHAESFPAELAEISSYQTSHKCEILYVPAEWVSRLRNQTFSHFHEVVTVLQQLEAPCLNP